jgi:hypothetical protein
MRWRSPSARQSANLLGQLDDTRLHWLDLCGPGLRSFEQEREQRQQTDPDGDRRKRHPWQPTPRIVELGQALDVNAFAH